MIKKKKRKIKEKFFVANIMTFLYSKDGGSPLSN